MKTLKNAVWDHSRNPENPTKEMENTRVAGRMRGHPHFAKSHIKLRLVSLIRKILCPVNVTCILNFAPKHSIGATLQVNGRSIYAMMLKTITPEHSVLRSRIRSVRKFSIFFSHLLHRTHNKRSRYSKNVVRLPSLVAPKTTGTIAEAVAPRRENGLPAVRVRAHP